MSSPVLGSATARIVGRRRCSKRLAFYDLRELADVDPDARAVLDAHFGTEGTAAAAPRSVELVAKACSAGFADEAELAVAQKECLKLGNVVRVHGAVSYTHLRAHETRHDLVCRLLLEKKKQ